MNKRTLHFGRRLKQVLREKGMSYEHFCEAADISLKRLNLVFTFGQFKREILRKYCRAIKIRISEFLFPERASLMYFRGGSCNVKTPGMSPEKFFAEMVRNGSALGLKEITIKWR